MDYHKLIYKNFFGEFNILITETKTKKTRNDTFISDREILNSHIWVNDNVVQKNHTPHQKVFELHKTISTKMYSQLLDNPENLLTKKELAHFAYSKIFHKEIKMRKVFNEEIRDAYFSGFLNLLELLKK